MSIQEAPILATTGFFTIGLGLILLLWGYLQAKNKNFNNHRNFMLVAAFVNAAFLVQYVTRYLLGQETHFPGPINIRNFVYYPILIIHIAGAIITIVLVLVHLYRSLIHENRTDTGQVFFPKDYRTDHRSFGRITFYFWFTSFVGGIIIFLMLYVIF